MKYLMAIVEPDHLNAVVAAIKSGPAADVNRIIVSDVICHSQPEGVTAMYRGHIQRDNLLHKVRLEMVVDDRAVQATIDAIMSGALTKQTEDEGVLVLDLLQYVRNQSRETEALAISSSAH